jgi:hypothetical protein
VRDGEVAALTERLRVALARQARARQELADGRADEVAALAELRRLGLSWWKVASKLAPIQQRRRLAAQLRLHAHRLRVSRCNTIRRDERLPDSPAAPPAAPSSEEVNTMKNDTKLIRRTVTEEVFESAVPDEDLDGADEDLDGAEDETDDAGPASPARRRRRA